MTAPHSNYHMRVRRNLISFLLALVAVCWASGLSAQIPDVPGWDLVWNDEFEGTSLNTTNWTALDRRNSFNNELQYYHPNQVTVSGGNLELTAIDVPRQGKAYQSGLVTSNDSVRPWAIRSADRLADNARNVARFLAECQSCSLAARR